MFESRKLSRISNKMRRYKLQVLEVSEVRWTSSESTRTSTGETVPHAGVGGGQSTQLSYLSKSKGTLIENDSSESESPSKILLE